MANITIHNVKLFDRYLGAILKFVSGCKFDLDQEKCVVRSRDDSLTVRNFFTTDCVVSDVPVSFCIGDLSCLCKSIKTLGEFIDDDAPPSDLTLTYDGTFLRLNDVIEFKLKTIKEATIAAAIDKAISSDIELKQEYGFTLLNPMMKKLCSMAFVSSAEVAKVYIYKKDDTIVGEVDDKSMAISNSIQIPISRDFFGDWHRPIITNMDKLRMLNLLDVDRITIAMTNYKVVEAFNEAQVDGSYAKIHTLLQVLKK